MASIRVVSGRRVVGFSIDSRSSSRNFIASRCGPASGPSPWAMSASAGVWDRNGPRTARSEGVHADSISGLPVDDGPRPLMEREANVCDGSGGRSAGNASLAPGRREVDGWADGAGGGPVGRCESCGGYPDGVVVGGGCFGCVSTRGGGRASGQQTRFSSSPTGSEEASSSSFVRMSFREQDRCGHLNWTGTSLKAVCVELVRSGTMVCDRCSHRRRSDTTELNRPSLPADDRPQASMDTDQYSRSNRPGPLRLNSIHC